MYMISASISITFNTSVNKIDILVSSGRDSKFD